MNKGCMKKIVTRVIVAGICAVALTSAAFISFKHAKADEIKVEKDQTEEKYVKLTEEFINHLLNKEADAFSGFLADSLVEYARENYGEEYATNEGLVNMWYVAVTNSIENNVVKSVKYEGKDDNYTAVSVNIQNELIDSTWIVNYDNKDSKVTGFYHEESKMSLNETDDFKEYSMKVGEYELEGILNLPKNVEKPAVVILIPGSGYGDANAGGIFSNIAHDLGKQGIATLRFSERFYQYPELAATNNTLYTESIDDVCAAVDMLLADERVSSDNIFLLGQSLGGMLAPRVAELRPQVKGVISFAGTPRKLVDVLYDQYTMVCDESNQEMMTYEYRDKVINDIKNITAEYDDISGAEITDDMTEDEKKKMEDYRFWRQYSDTYWLSCHNFDVEEYVSNINVPMLIMQGESDVNVFADKDYVEWQRILAGRDNCHFKLYPGLNHIFKVQKHAGYLNNIKDYSEPGRIESYVTDDISKFVHQYTTR